MNFKQIKNTVKNKYEVQCHVYCLEVSLTGCCVPDGPQARGQWDRGRKGLREARTPSRLAQTHRPFLHIPSPFPEPAQTVPGRLAAPGPDEEVPRKGRMKLATSQEWWAGVSLILVLTLQNTGTQSCLGSFKLRGKWVSWDLCIVWYRPKERVFCGTSVFFHLILLSSYYALGTVLGA